MLEAARLKTLRKARELDQLEMKLYLLIKRLERRADAPTS